MASFEFVFGAELAVDFEVFGEVEVADELGVCWNCVAFLEDELEGSVSI